MPSDSSSKSGRRYLGRLNAILIEPWRDGSDPIPLPAVCDILQEAGITVRRVGAGMTLQDLQSLSDASLSINLTTFSQPLARLLSETFSVDEIPLHLSFSAQEIDAAYRAVEEALGVSIIDRFTDSRNELIALEARAKELFASKKFIFMRGVDMPVPLATYLASLGMEPVILQIEDILPQDMPFIKRLNGMGFDPPACRFMNMDLDIEILAGMNADLYFGALPDPRDDIKTVERMYDFYGKVGYERSAKLLQRMITVYETGKMAVKSEWD